MTCFCEITDKLIYARFIKFFRKHDVIYPKQYGFQKKVSTTHAMLDVVTTIYDNIYEKLFSGLLLIDLRKAFDTVCSQTLLIKMEQHRIREVAYNLVNSYLYDRKQFVALNQTCSKTHKIQYGVPQGSFLGPLFFLVYINDLKTAVNCNPRLFADGSCLIVTAPSISLFQKKINNDLSRFREWCCVNKLTTNPFKTNALLYSPTLKLTDDLQINIQFADTPITITHSAKYLGLINDSNFDYKQYINTLECKVGRAIGILYKLKNTFPQIILKQLYFALIHPLLLYGITAWGSTFSTHLHRQQILQNKAVRAVVGAHYHDSAKFNLANLQILQIDDLFKFEIAIFVFKWNRNSVPISFSNFFKKTSDVSKRITRQSSKSSNLYIPRYRSNRLQRSIKYQGVKVWNSISENIKKLSEKFIQETTQRLFLIVLLRFFLLV